MSIFHSPGGARSRSAKGPAAVLCALALVIAGTAGAGLARADAFGVTAFDVNLLNADGSPSTQAGAHPYEMDLHYGLTTQSFPDGVLGPNGALKDTAIDLPQGLIGDPTALPRCSHERIAEPPDFNCPPDTQIGQATVTVAGDASGAPPLGLYNMEPPAGDAAQFAFNFGNVQTVFLDARVVRSGGRNRIRVTVANASQKLAAYDITVSLWGVPADPRHDANRCKNAVAPDGHCPGIPGDPVLDSGAPHSVDVPIKPFLTNPTSCGVPLTTDMRVTTWSGDAVSASAVVGAGAGTPTIMTGCDKLAFAPSIDVRPDDPVAGEPSGYAVDLSVPQDDNPAGLAVAQLRNTVVTMPLGTAVSPSSADGLGACTSAEIGLENDDAPSCPLSSRIGTVSIETPLLPDPLTGDVYLATQSDNPFNSMLALYLVVEGPGVRLKLAGRVVPDPATGQLLVTFDDTPQLPFSALHLHLKGGSRAPLVNPRACGQVSASAQLTSWAGSTASSTSPVTISGDGAGGPCAAPRFAPVLRAGTQSALAGVSSPFSFQLTRTDADGEIQSIHAVLPAGLLAQVKGVPLCPSAAAAAGTCGEASLVGHVTVGAGAGSLPFYLSGGRVYLTEGYQGGAFGLSMVVPAVAGPLNLGTVVVRAAIHLDPKTAQISVDTDPLPAILAGIPLELRDIRLTMDRPGFMINPTNCAEQQVTAAVTSTTGAVANTASRFDVGGCAALALRPKLALSLSPSAEMGKGKHPILHAHLAQSPGQSGLATVQVHLPKALGIDLQNAAIACKAAAAAAHACPDSSIVGRASAVTVLPQPLEGPVYFVERTRTDSVSGKAVPALPGLFVPLRGDGVEIDLSASSAVSGGRLTSSFDDIPDAPISAFDLTLDGGSHGILVTSKALCTADQQASMDVAGQNGKTLAANVPVSPSCRLRALAQKLTANAVSLRLSGLSAGSLRVRGAGLRSTTRRLSAATVAWVRARLTGSAARAIRSGRRTAVVVKVAFTPAGGQTVVRSFRVSRRP